MSQLLLERVRQRIYPKLPYAYSVVDSTLHEIEKELGLLDSINRCQGCSFHQTCTKKVLGIGPLNADIMFVGEAPDPVDDQSGTPFVGPAGQLLDKAIQAVGWRREDIYMTYLLKCRPNISEVKQEHVEECFRFIRYEIDELVKPKVVVCWGELAAKTLVYPQFTMANHHGRWFKHPDDVIYIGVHSPSYILQCEGTEFEIPVKQQVFDVLLKIKEYQQSGFQQIPVQTIS